MGASLSWFAVRGKTSEAVLQDFGLKHAARGCRDTPFSGGMLPSGWFIVIHGRHEYTEDEVRRLSRGCEVVACFVEEHVMVSRAAGWKGGEPIWCVAHDSEQGDGHLAVEGEPPHVFASICERLTNRQQEDGGADFIFNIPVALAKELTGYSHEETPDVTFENFVKPTFLQKVFGR